MKTLPDGLKPMQQTPEFDEHSIPKGLLSAHQTKAGVWATIVILKGTLQYTIHEPEEETLILDSNTPGIIEPTTRHKVTPLGPVRFYIAFYQQTADN